MKPTFPNIAAIVDYRSRIEEKLPTAVPQTDTCLCGKPKAPNHIICLSCWATAPKDAKRQSKNTALSTADRKGAFDTLKAHARTARQITLLSLGLCFATGCGRLTESESAFAKAVFWAFAVVGAFTLGGIVAYHRNKGDKEMGIADPDERDRADAPHTDHLNQ
jgi:hypothetical protein